MVKKTVKKNKTENTFKESQILVVLEKMGDDIKLIAEGQMGFREEMNKNFDILFEFKENTEKNILVIMEYLKRIDDELQDIKSEIRDVKNKEKATDGWRTMMEKRISEIEKALQKQKILVARN